MKLKNIKLTQKLYLLNTKTDQIYDSHIINYMRDNEKVKMLILGNISKELKVMPEFKCTIDSDLPIRCHMLATNAGDYSINCYLLFHKKELALKYKDGKK